MIYDPHKKHIDLVCMGKCTHDASFSKAVLVGKACQKKVFTISKH